MMFKCKECGSEYDTKPDYCDCGNDTFDEIVVQETSNPVTPQKTEQVKTSEPKPPVSQKVYSNETKKTSSGQYSELNRLKNIFDPISSVFLLVCVITSLVVLFFVGNPKEELQAPEQPANVEAPKLNIPSIDSFWNNSTAGIINNEKYMAQKYKQVQSVPQQSQQTTPITVQILPKQETQTTPKQVTNTAEPRQTGQQQAQQKPQSTSVIGKIFGNNNNNTQQTNNKNTQKPAQQTQQKTTTQTQPKTSTQANPAPRIPQTTQTIATQHNQMPTQNNKPVQTTQPTTLTQPQKQTVQTQQMTNTQNNKPAQNTAQNVNVSPSTTLRPKATIDTQAQKREFDNYKVGLRNTIGRKVDFTRVVGDGECIVAFKVASNGKLTNRSFAKQSSNVTLNDAVYSAIMATPNYNPPPSGYNNETLNLKIRFYGGNYDVSLY